MLILLMGMAQTIEHTETNFKIPMMESIMSLSFQEKFSPQVLDYQLNPNIFIEIKDLRKNGPHGFRIQAGLLINRDRSCWITNLGPKGSTVVYRAENDQNRSLDYNQVAFLRHGDFVGFFNHFFKVIFSEEKLIFQPIPISDFPTLF